MTAVVVGLFPVLVADETQSAILPGAFFIGSGSTPPATSAAPWLRRGGRHILRMVSSAVVVFVVVPNAPSQVEFTGGVGGGTVTWAAPAVVGDSALISYSVYWGQTEGQQGPGGTFVGVVGVAAGTLTKTLSGLSPTGTWYVAVTATNSAGESSPSPEAIGTVT